MRSITLIELLTSSIRSSSDFISSITDLISSFVLLRRSGLD